METDGQQSGQFNKIKIANILALYWKFNWSWIWKPESALQHCSWICYYIL